MYWYYKVLFGSVGLAILLLLGFVAYRNVPGLANAFSGGSTDTSVEGVIVPENPADSDTENHGAEPVPPGSQHGTTPAGLDQASVQAVRQLMSVRKLIQEGESKKAREICYEILDDPALQPYSEGWLQTVEELSGINRTMLFTDAPADNKVTYLVSSGDSVWKIAKQHNVTMTMVMKSNGIDPANGNVFPGQALKIFLADWNLQVSKTHRYLLLRDGDRILIGYRIGIGREDRTPVGTFRIDTKETEPAWTYKGIKYDFGHEKNVLGTRWMGLEVTGDTNSLLQGYGIHGTWVPESIGGTESNGCIRMINSQVEELYDIVPYNTPVIIKE